METTSQAYTFERLPPGQPDEIQYTRPSGALRQGPPLNDPPPDPRRPLAIAMLANFVEDIAYGVAERGWLYTNGTAGGFEWACERFGVAPAKARSALLVLLAKREDRGYYVAKDGGRERLSVGKPWQEGEGAEGAVWAPPNGARTTLGPRLCQHCLVVWFVPVHGSARYCSDKCFAEQRRLTEKAKSAKRRELGARWQRRAKGKEGNFRYGEVKE